MLNQMRWTSEKIGQRLHLIEPLIYRRRQLLSPFRLQKLPSPLTEPPIDPNLSDADWTVIEPNSHWLEPQTNFVLRSRFHIPSAWDSGSPTALHLPLGEAGDFSHPEALAYVDGTPYAACDRHHQEILLPELWRGGETHSLALHGWTGGTHTLRWHGDADSEKQSFTPLIMGECAVVQIDQPTRDFVVLARVTLGIADQLHENNPVQAHLYNALDMAFKALDTRDPLGERFYASVPLAYKTLRAGVDRSGAPMDVSVTVVGHAHIDIAWLWTLGQARRKAGRTFHNVLRLMEQFPEFRFTQSQPQLYDYVRQDYPDLFRAIQEKVQTGQWEPIGGMWAEADCNLSGGESLARQFLLGRQFFRKHFGATAESPVLWLPDVFGYAWNLPQLIKEAGLDYFFTIKIGWSEYNRFPYDSFWWQGLDGTRVLTHFSPTKAAGSAKASTYNGDASPQQTLSTWTNFQQKDGGKPGVTPPLLMSYGFGDGGGGPTHEMLENIREMDAFPAAPRTQCGTAGDFFRQLETEVGDHLPTWNGELYLEYHRGTYTTQARNKRANRKSEFLLHDAEFLATVTAVFDPTYAYPHKDLRRAWELVCLNQFHDILPGSSIGEVYMESLAQYAEVAAIGERVRQGALSRLAEKIGGGAFVVNPTSFTRCEPVFVSNPSGFGKPGFQHIDGGVLVNPGELPPYSITPLTNQIEPSSLQITPSLLENDFLRVELNDAGDIVQIYDKENGRDVLPNNSIANQFQVFEDRPRTPDAWEIDISYDDKMWLAEAADSITVIETGPLRAMLEIKRRIFNSYITQRISLTHDSPRLDFATTAVWRERHTMLKVAFPIDVLSPTATYEIQWGNVQRPTHRNTSWDWARFETCAQKWVDLSEGGYGVSLLNDCKYGHDIHDNIIRLTLLRGPTDPDPEADLGEHQFTYSLLPHAGGWDEKTVAAAYALNDPLIVFANNEMESSAPSLPDTSSFISIDQPNVVIETIKLAEDGHGVIVRLYEFQRQRGDITLTTNFPLASAWRTNLLEENQEEVVVNGRSLSIAIKPYQILTLHLLPNFQKIAAKRIFT
ncbi:MAG: alpha-mannosidase [Chloroflexi bacterium]|nr:alpha-mannosidase [Chloroflexota bacterium]